MRLNIQTISFFSSLVLVFTACKPLQSSSPDNETHSEIVIAKETSGVDFLTHGQYGQPSLNDEIFANLWRVWDGDDAQKAQRATDDELKTLTYARYGLIKAPYANDGLPMGYAKGSDGLWYSNCLLCHGGSILGEPMIGAPNNRIDMTTLNEDIFLLTSTMNGVIASRPVHLPMQMNTSKGVTNAVIFSHELLKNRDRNLDFIELPVDLGLVIDHDLDAPAWWNVRHKTRLYVDAFVPKNPRALMQFSLTRENSGDELRAMLPEFEKVLTYLNTIEAPKYRGEINVALAQKGMAAFEVRCAGCHGTYGDSRRYPNKLIPAGVVKTDPVRLAGLTKEFRAYYRDSWLGNYGQIDVTLEGKGYVAPPLDGIWASAPYLHNGSVPTLYHILHPNERPAVWRVRDYESYDHEKMGLVIDVFTQSPTEELTGSERRRYYDTTKVGKSNQGHLFPNALSEDEKHAVLEYLKTL